MRDRLRRALRPPVETERTVRTPRGPLRVRTLDVIACPADVRAAAREQVAALQIASMRPATHGRCPAVSLVEAARMYGDRTFDPAVPWTYNRLVRFFDGDALVASGQARARPLIVDGETVELIGMNAFVRPEWRGQKLMNTAFVHAASAYARQRLGFRGPRYYAGVAMTPAGYRAAVRGARCVWPAPDGRRDPHAERVHRAAFADVVDADGVVPEPWASGVDDAEIARWARSTDPAVRLYLEKNPRYAEGFGLPNVVRSNAGDVLYSIAQMAADAIIGRRLRPR